MRRFFVSATSIIVALLTYSCSKELDSPQILPVSEENLHEVTITATLESSPQTRTSRDASGAVYWSPGDKISLFYGSGTDGGKVFTSTNTATALTTSFTGTIDAVTLDSEHEGMTIDDIYFWGIYPYREDNACDGNTITTTLPDVQTAKAGTFDDNLFISMGRSLGLNIAFYNVCSGIRFQVTHPDIEQIVFSGNNNEVIAGKVKVGFDANGKPEVKEVLDGKTTITLKAPNGGTFQTGTDYYIVLFPKYTLSAGMTMTFIMRDGNTAIRRWSKSKTFTRSIFMNYLSPTIDDDQYATFMETVDLGLTSGTLWATCNLGATTPEGAGNYYAWGELAPRTGSYGSANSTISAKYQNSSLTELEPEDDAAYYLMGGDWRLPTQAQFQELKTECTWTQATQNGVSGFTVTGTNGNSIFIPAAGSIRSGTTPSLTTQAFLWSSTKSSDDPKAYGTVVYESSSVLKEDIIGSTIGQGLSIRPVRSIVPVTSIEIEGKQGMTVLSSQQLVAKIYPSNATLQHVTWSSSDESIATVSQDGVVTAQSRGNTTIYAESADHGKTAVLDLWVAYQPGVVDLGLPSGTKWAPYDIGAWTTGSAGWRFYVKKATPGTNSYTPEGDAAAYFFGEGWSRPTKEQIQELIDNCNWNYYSGFMTDKPGWYATSKIEGYTDKRIFFPVDPTYSSHYYWSNNWEFVGNPYYSYGSYSLRFTDQNYELGFITDNSQISSPKGYIRPVKNN
jgi:hypothetical protein